MCPTVWAIARSYQMENEIYFRPDRIPLGKEKWHSFLKTLKDELATFLDCKITETALFWDGENVSDDSFSTSIDIVAHVFPKANLQYAGVIGYTKNYDETAYADVFLLAYIHGKRVTSDHKAFEYLRIAYDLKAGWNTPKWLDDTYGEWESYTDMKRWEH